MPQTPTVIGVSPEPLTIDLTQSLGWTIFAVVVVVMMAVDLGVFHRKPRDPSFREALTWVFIWVGVAALFNVYIYSTRGEQPATDFLIGYLVEQSLSVDNIFVFLLIFTYFKVGPDLQRRVLIYGIIGAIVARGAMILGLNALVSRFLFLIYVLAAILIYSGIKMWRSKGVEYDASKSIFFRFARRLFPVTEDFEGTNFFVRRDGRIWATPLFVVLVVIDGADVVFALDSIPAILAITRDPFILITSNAFAILGLRSLYFVVQSMMRIFHHLHYGLSFILVAIGAKMIAQEAFHMKISSLITLGLIVAVIALCIVTSLIWPEEAPAKPPAASA